jgi:small GTP-binding protein
MSSSSHSQRTPRAVFSNTRADIKIVVVGFSGTGKTSFCVRWTKGTFSTEYNATIMSEFAYKIIEYKGNLYKIQIWDIAGQDKSIYTSRVFTKNSHGVIVFSEFGNKETLDKAVKWKNSIDSTTKFKDGENLPAILIQNKIDLYDVNNNNDEDEMKIFCDKNGFLKSFKTSVLKNEGIEEAMDFLIENVIDRLELYSKSNNVPIDENKRTSIVIESSNNDNKRKSLFQEKKKYYCC